MAEDLPLPGSLMRKLEDFGERVAPALLFDVDTRSELLSHVEEKAAAYRKRTEPLSDDDILLLIERHFGEAETIRDCCAARTVKHASEGSGRRQRVSPGDWLRYL